MSELLKTIKGRKSVRTFDGRPVSPEDREKLIENLRLFSSLRRNK